jgi:hypothetical protein
MTHRGNGGGGLILGNVRPRRRREEDGAGREQ